jgi:Ca2+-transporting ATPase
MPHPDSKGTADIHRGLSAAQVETLRRGHGENRLPAEKKRSVLSLVLVQIKSPLVYIILVAAGISLAVGELSDFIIIMAVVVADVILGFIQEYQAQQTYTALKGLLKPTTTVIRDGRRQEIEVWELVPDDLVVLAAGERVPGDGVLIETNKFSVDEAILTGESEPVVKSTTAGVNVVFAGTTVVTGRGTLKVTKTGMKTELGAIAQSLGEHVEEETPLQARLKAFSKTFTYIVLGFTILILITGLIMGRSILDMIRTSIILAIAAVPEGLLIAVTVILVLGMRKVLKRNGLVKRLLAVETLGSVTTICTDKTGTITQGMMRVTKVDLANREHAFQTMVLCNDLEGPVDIALWEYAKAQLKRDPQEIYDRSERYAEELFTSETKHMVTYTKIGADRHYFLKGAPEIILDQCDVEPSQRQAILTRVDEWAASGLRLIGLAYRTRGELEEHSGYSWAGLVGMEDPIREEVIDSIKLAHAAGIKVKMITGDYRVTAERIARNVGIMSEGDELMEGEELASIDDQTLQERIPRIAVFARIRPQDKLRIIKALQANGEIAAMVGDGVNDAPALKRANIGVVVGSATDVAKETADLILLDNSFRTIVAAIEEGRVIFENIQKVVAFVLSNSFAEVITIFIAMMLGWPAPLLVAQILWIHLICDGPSDIVLGFEPKEKGIMQRRPKKPNEPILTRLGSVLIAIISVGSSLTALALFYYYYTVLGDLKSGQTIVFASFAIKTLIYIFAYRSMKLPLPRMNPITANKPLIYAVLSGIAVAVIPLYVPWLRNALGVAPLHLNDWIWVAGISVGLLIVVEIGKWLNSKLQPREEAHGGQLPS